MNSESKNLLKIKNDNSSKEKSFITNKFQVFIIILFILFYIDSKLKNIKIVHSLKKIEKILLTQTKTTEENKYLQQENMEIKKIVENKSINKAIGTIELLKLMTNNDEDKYKGAENCLLNENNDSELCLYRFLCPKEVVGKKRVLVGKKVDKGYVLLDDFKNVKIAYSFGINDKVEFDIELADRGIDVYIYDNKIESLPHKSALHFKKLGLGGNPDKNNLIKTLDELIKENGHSSEKDMILKLNIELLEWNALLDLSKNILNQFKYIILDIHFSKNNKLYYDALKKLNKTHQVFYINCNNGGNIITFGNNRVCEFIEVSYIIRENNIFNKDSTIYPIPEFTAEKQKSELNLNIFKLFDS